MAFGPFLMLFRQDGAEQADGAWVGKITTTSVRRQIPRLTCLFGLFDRIRRQTHDHRMTVTTACSDTLTGIHPQLCLTDRPATEGCGQGLV